MRSCICPLYRLIQRRLEYGINQRSSKCTNHCGRFTISAIIEDLIEHFYSFAEGRKKRWIPLTQNSGNAEGKSFHTHLDLNQ
jgi:hypothetical protein